MASRSSLGENAAVRVGALVEKARRSEIHGPLVNVENVGPVKSALFTVMGKLTINGNL